MLKKTITYTDWDGNQRTENFYFNLSKSEIMKLQFSVPGGFDKKIYSMLSDIENINEGDSSPVIKEISEFFDFMILKSFGEKSADGKRFVKSEEISKEFMSTPAYDALYMEIINDPEKAMDFISSVIPPEYSENVNTEEITERINNGESPESIVNSIGVSNVQEITANK